MRFNPNGEDVRPNVDDYEHQHLRKSYDKSTYTWQPNNENGEILRISKSSLGSFDFCPKSYFYQKILNLPQEQKDYHVRGLNVHDITEYFWEHVSPVIPELLELIENEDLNIARSKMAEVIPSPPSPYIYGEDIQIQRWLDCQFDRLVVTKGENWLPIGNEAEVHAFREIEVDGQIIPFHMRGFIDRIFDDGEGGYILMELKTGKWMKPPNRKTASMRAEMQFYRMMLDHSPHMEYLPITHWGWEFPGGDINGGDGAHWGYESVSTRGAKYAPKTVEKRIKRLIRAHLKSEFPTEAHERKCEYCDFMDICPAWSTKELSVI